MLRSLAHPVRRGAFTLLEVLLSLSILVLFTVGVTGALLSLNDSVPRSRHLTSADSLLWSQISQALVLNYTVGTGTNANPAQLSEVLKTSTDVKNPAAGILATANFDYTAGTYTLTPSVTPPYRSLFVPSFEEFDGRDYTTVAANPFGANKVWQVTGVPIYNSASPNRADIATVPDRIAPVVPGNFFRQVTLTDTLPGESAKFFIDGDANNKTSDLGIRIVDVAVTYSYRGRPPATVTMSTFRAPN